MLTLQDQVTQHYGLCGLHMRVVASPDLVSAIDARLHSLSLPATSLADLSFSFGESAIDCPLLGQLLG